MPSRGTSLSSPRDTYKLVLVVDARNNVGIWTGAGTPEGNVTAGVGSTYHNRTGAGNSSYYVKESGTGATGWQPK